VEHPEALSRALQRWSGKLANVGLESGSMTPWLARELAKAGFPVVCMDARAAADAVKSRRVKSDKADAYALAEMLRGLKAHEFIKRLSLQWSNIVAPPRARSAGVRWCAQR
jgi:transposase